MDKMKENTEKELIENVIDATALNVIGSIAEYSSLLWGIYSIQKEEPNIWCAVGAGVIFAYSRLSNFLSNNYFLKFKSRKGDLQEKIEDLEKKVE